MTPSSSKDALGQPLVGYTELRKAWADIRNMGGLEAIKAGAVASTVKASIRLRWCSDLNSGMRVVFGASTYNVLAVLPDLIGKRWVDLACEIIQ